MQHQRRRIRCRPHGWQIEAPVALGEYRTSFFGNGPVSMPRHVRTAAEFAEVASRSMIGPGAASLGPDWAGTSCGPSGSCARRHISNAKGFSTASTPMTIRAFRSARATGRWRGPKGTSPPSRARWGAVFPCRSQSPRGVGRRRFLRQAGVRWPRLGCGKTLRTWPWPAGCRLLPDLIFPLYRPIRLRAAPPRDGGFFLQPRAARLSADQMIGGRSGQGFGDDAAL